MKDGYVAGDHLTIADFAVTSSLTTIEVVDHDLSKFPRIQAYLEKMKKMDGYQETNGDGVEQMGAWAKSSMPSA